MGSPETHFATGSISLPSSLHCPHNICQPLFVLGVYLGVFGRHYSQHRYSSADTKAKKKDTVVPAVWGMGVWWCGSVIVDKKWAGERAREKRGGMEQR